MSLIKNVDKNNTKTVENINSGRKFDALFNIFNLTILLNITSKIKPNISKRKTDLDADISDWIKVNVIIKSTLVYFIFIVVLAKLEKSIGR